MTSPLDASLFREPLLALYADLDATIAQLAPRCDLSGRCCRFEEYGHTLFVSAPEMAVLLADSPAPTRPVDDGQTCPWQDLRGHCTARNARPIGCRVYFCDPSYQSHAPDVSETYLRRLKDFVAANELPWNYAPLHRHLKPLAECGWGAKASVNSSANCTTVEAAQST
jgi:hypothetical protein